MKIRIAVGLASLCSTALLAQDLPPLHLHLPLPAPHAASPVKTSPPEPRMVAWLPGEVRCEGESVTAVTWRRPYLALSYGGTTPVSTTYRFRLDPNGRPLSIGRATPGYLPLGDDIAPSLAASRFARGGERRDCTVTYTARTTSYADTPAEDLISYSLNPTNGQLPREGWAAIYPTAVTCDDEPRPAPLNQAFPDFASVAGTPGVRDWTMLAYDLDAKGAPRQVRVLTGTGNRALDAAGAAALARSRYTGGPRTGCRFPYWKAAEIMPAPDIPPQGSLRSDAPPAACEGEWVSKPPLSYPDAYRKRAIEGWAVIGFDVAPWGGTGNVTVLASEPSAEFGERAAALSRNAKRAPSEAGATGCIDRIVYRMGRPGMEPTEMVGG